MSDPVIEKLRTQAPPLLPRPYWHVDAKWIAALLWAPVLAATLVALILVQITAEGPAVAMTSQALDGLTRGQADEGGDEQSIEQLIASMEASGEDTIEPFPGYEISLSLEDLRTRSPEELRRQVFRQLAEAIYWSPLPLGLGASSEAGDEQTLLNSLGALAVFTHEGHLLLRRVTLVLLAANLPLLGALVLFSYRFGRIASPGCVLFVVGLTGFAVAVLMRFRPGEAGESPSTGEGLAALMQALGAALRPALDVAMRTFAVAMMSGVFLVVLASLVWSRRRRKAG